LVDSFSRIVAPSVVSGLAAWGAAVMARPYSRVAEVIVAGVVLGVVYVVLACVMAREDVVQLLVRLKLPGLAAKLERRNPK
jgi:hypothetical protein